MLLHALISTALAGPPLPAGTYTLSNSPRDLEAQRSAAVDVAVGDMNFAWAAIARSQLEDAIRWCDQYVFTPDDTRFIVECDDIGPVIAPLDGRTVSFKSKTGASGQVRFEQTDADVALYFSTRAGGQETRYRLREDGSLLVEKVIRNEHLSAPARWTMRYRDAG